MPITLKNSMSGKLEDLQPIDAKNVRIYVCGPTVYDRAHLGNARSAVVFDMLFRLLRHTYGVENVTYVRNFTDVDDKINAKSAQTGRPIKDITDETIGWYMADMGALNVLEPTHMPRATEYIGEMLAMIGKLIRKGHAYISGGHVYFSVKSDPDYGRLSGRPDIENGAETEPGSGKRDAEDFVLWKPSTPDLPSWDSPWGAGRPGWHIECSAMSAKLLGPRFDIHGGGSDLMFPHHENELAQSCCANGHDSMASIWMHNEMLTIENRKMAKSSGNFFTVRDLLDQGHDGEAMRLVILMTHHGKSLDWNDGKLSGAHAALKRWRAATRGVEAGAVDADVLEILSRNLNTAGVMARLYEIEERGDVAGLKASLNLLGLLEQEQSEETPTVDLTPYAVKLALLRGEAMLSKDFSKADSFRQALAASGVIVRITGHDVDLSCADVLKPGKLPELT